MSSIIQKGIKGFFFGATTSGVGVPISEPIKEVLKPRVIDEDDEPQKKKKKIPKVDEEDENDNKSYDLALKILGDSMFEIKNKKMFVVPLMKLKHLNLNPYRHQREYNQEHVEVLKKGLLQTGFLYHPIVLIHIPNRKEISIIDGQHRFKALKSILENIREGIHAEIQVQIELLECEDYDTKIMNIYKNVNTCQPIDMNKIILEEDYVKLIQKLKNVFGKKTIDEYKTKAKHYIIESKLKTELMAHNLLIKYSDEELVKRIVRKNEDLKEEHLILGELKEDVVKKCEKNDFCLGTEFPKWLKEL